jgi:hypothetical protein
MWVYQFGYHELRGFGDRPVWINPLWFWEYPQETPRTRPPGFWAAPVPASRQKAPGGPS